MPEQPDFPPVSRAEWAARAERDLRGRPLSDLDFTVAGRSFPPLHDAGDLDPERDYAPLRQRAGWLIGERIPAGDPAEANRLALAALAGGANALAFVVDEPPDPATREQLLRDVITDIVEITYEPAHSPHGFTTLDELGAQLRTAAAAGPAPLLRYHVTTDDHLTVLATHRALRRAWATLATAAGHRPPCRLATRVFLDPAEDMHTNQIRAAARALAAVSGGTDLLYVDPSDGFPGSAFTRRLSRNVQHLLAEEHRLQDHPDPAAGSYYLETLTDHLAEQLLKRAQ